MKTLLLALLSLAVLPTYAGTITGQIQGPSGLAVKNATLNFTLNQAGLIVGTGAVVPTTASCYTDGSGNVVGLPNQIVAPTAAVNLGSGTLPGGIYFIQSTWINNAGGESAPSPELRIQLSSTGSFQIALPTSVPAGATGLHIYAATTSGAETLQGTQGLPGPFNFGALISGANPPASNNTTCQIAFNDTIIPMTGYTVSLISSSGNAYPGYPQSWQLNGGATGTVNISQGAPLWNGVVVYPMPLLSQPLNHGPQSISGNLDHGGYNDTNIGTLTAGTVNSVVNANLQPGADIGAKINNGLQACAQQCTVYVPAGAYSFATTIVLPLLTYSNYTLSMDAGAVLTYTGSGDAIYAPVSPTANVSHWSVYGGQLIGTSAAVSGVHVQPTNSASITGMLITGFTNGSGIWLEGANGVTVFNNDTQGNQNGIKLSPTYCNGSTCGTGVTGSGFTPNQIYISSNRITNNSQWGIISTDPVTAGLSGALAVIIHGNDLEINGSAGPTYGAINFGRSHGLVIDGANYFEASPREIVLGIPGGGDGNSFRFFASQGPNITGNFFTDEIATPYDIELLDTADAQINGNTTNFGTQNSSNCFVNTLANNGTNIGETGTFYGNNHVEHYSGGASTLCIGGSPVAAFVGANSFALVNSNKQPYLVAPNYTINNSGTSENVTVSPVQLGSMCSVVPAVDGAQTTALASAFVVTGTNVGKLTHPGSSVGVHVAIFCTPNAPN